MPRGVPPKWAKLSLLQPVWMNKRGVSIVVWDKWGRRRKGTLEVSIGGLRWYPFKGKRARRISWDRFAATLEGD